MNNVNENKISDIKLIKHFIKDLSFENPQSLNQHNADYNNDNKINVNLNVIHEAYDGNYFSLIMKYTLDCSSKKKNKKLFHLELDYFGFFKTLDKGDIDQKLLTEKGLNIIFPFAKEVIEHVTQRGGSVPISLNKVDFSLVEN